MLGRGVCRLDADMAEHEPCIGATDDWYTPPDIFDALGLIFDLDPCSPGPAHWVPARKIYTKEDDGLVQPWSGTVLHESAVWPTQWPCALATQVPRAQRWRRDCARVHEQRMVSPMGCEGANNVLPARQDEVHSTGWVDRSSSRTRRRSARHGRGSEQGAGAVRARLVRADRYLRCDSNRRRGTHAPVDPPSLIVLKFQTLV